MKNRLIIKLTAMKKLLCYMLCMIMVLSLVACYAGKEGLRDDNSNDETDQNNLDNVIAQGNEKESTDYQKDPTMITVNPNGFTASSLQDFLKKFLGEYAQTTDQSATIVRAVNNRNLVFDNYEIMKIFYAPTQDLNQNFTGEIVLKLFWHEKGCTSSVHDYCDKVTLDLIYLKDWMKKGYMNEYNKTETENLYVAEFYNEYNGVRVISYFYSINDMYFCRFDIDSNVSDKEEIKKQLAKFCTEFAGMLDNNEYM